MINFLQSRAHDDMETQKGGTNSLSIKLEGMTGGIAFERRIVSQMFEGKGDGKVVREEKTFEV